MAQPANTMFAYLIDESRVIVTCGAGGVGKTTVAAAIGLAAARHGRRCAVITIDPAKRLADALGLATLTNEPARVTLSHTVDGELWACMLDTKATFDAVVRREARDDDQAERILGNTFYRNISSSLSGTQEYMAMEKVHELVTSGRFDLVVVDTPPTQHALDFVTAPRRLVRLLDNTVFKLLIAPGRGALRVVSSAAQTVLRPLTKVIGGDVVTDAIEFFRAFDGMEEGFRSRASTTLELLTAGDTAWLLISSPQPDPIRAAIGFAESIRQAGISVRGVIVNRAEPHFDEVVTTPSPTLIELIADHDATVAEERVAIDGLLSQVDSSLSSTDEPGQRHDAIPSVTLAQRAGDVHDLDALDDMATVLLGA
jgi:anion-transporting  ArsA/GET3 family ATPase